ncbi:DoxX family protein [Mycolicibacterium komossense]|uniref:DoxX family protein n=1 Tax=Mycolicibacterium komossense TaxID=1779 RepID=A0ABT3C8P9_9MYCO|nr:DoxX family protein [Mycolicibacterium komossense]MCV7225601.1 DoxX family protein [Mycolicibacterium komossense]
MLLRRIARPMLSAAFIGQGIAALRSPKPAADIARPTLEGLQKLPDPVGGNVPTNAETFAKVNAAIQIGGGVLLATGKVPRLASAALAATVIPGNLGAHMFWSETDPVVKAQKRQDFLIDLSLLGGLIIASADTAGKPSLGWRGKRAARKLGDTVTSALPSGSNVALIDPELVEKAGHTLHAGAERGRDLVLEAGERSAPLVEAARKRAEELAEVAAERSAPLAKKARKRGAELADVASKRAEELADVASKRGEKFADVASKRSAEWAELARERGVELAQATRDQSEELASVAGKKARKKAKALKNR